MKRELVKTWTKSVRSPQWEKAEELVGAWEADCFDGVFALTDDGRRTLIARIEDALYGETHR